MQTSFNIIIEFNYESSPVIIQGNMNEPMQFIYQRFFTKIGAEKIEKNLYFLYNGKWLNCYDGSQNLTFFQMANEIDKKRGKMNILVAENTNVEKDLIIKSDDIICPQCGNYIFMSIKNYKISLFNCVNGHKMLNIPLNEFENTQNINLSKITCGFCSKKRSNIFKNEMNRCLTCKMNICPLCSSQHDRNHPLISYDEINYRCEKDGGDSFFGFCQSCNAHYCMSCANNHNNHQIIPFTSVFQGNQQINNSLAELKKYIDIFNEECEEIISVINNMKNTFNKYYNIKETMLKHFDIKNHKNIYIFSNLNEITNNKEIIKDISNIKNEISIKKKFNYIVDLYNMINNTQNINLNPNIDLSRENEELKRKCSYLKQSLDKAKSSLEKYLGDNKKLDLIKKIIFAGIDEKTKKSKYNMANKCLLTELALSESENKPYIDSVKIANVMLEVDRGDFAPNFCYLNWPIPIGYGVNISAPHMHAFALEYLAPFCENGARILDIGSGSGYLTVALSKMINDTGLVVGVEHIPQLYQFGLENVQKHHASLLSNGRIIFVNDDGRRGCKKYGPYKIIHVGAALEDLPRDIIDQLDYNGRMFIPIGPRNGYKEIYLIDKDRNGAVTYRSVASFVQYAMLQDAKTQLENQ